MMIHFNLITTVLPVNRRWHQTQLGMRTKAGAREYTDKKRSTTPPSATQSAFADHTETNFDDSHVGKDDPSELLTLCGGVIGSSLDEVPGCPPTVQIDCHTTLTSCVGVQTLPDETRITGLTTASAYPTDSHVDAKRRREAREAGKTPEEVKAMRKKKPQTQEQIFDDCGSDMELLEDRAAVAALAFTEPNEACFFFDRSGLSATFEEMSKHLEDSSFNLSYLYGSEVDDDDLYEADRAKEIHVDSKVWYQKLDQQRGDVDILEICGGAAGVSRLAVRRRLKSGGNLDLVTGVDLSSQSAVDDLMTYLETHKPLVVVMAPPCTTIGGWSHVRRVKNPEAL